MLDDPFAEIAVDDDPFASPEDLKRSGQFTPSPPIDMIADRLIVLVPREFDAEAKVSEYLQREYGLKPTREQWKTDLVILDGEPMSYPYRAKVQGILDVYEEKTWEIETFPYLVSGFRVTWGNVIGTLNKLSGGSKPFGLGRLRAGYSAKDMRSGKTYEQFAAEMAEWERKVQANPRTAGNKPKPTWHFVPSNEIADVAIARAWWKDAQASGFSVR